MIIAPDEKRNAARLFALLRSGERVAEDIARAQSGLAEDRFAQRFLRSQARQEAFHAHVFQGAIRFLSPRGVPDRDPPAMRRLHAMLAAAVARGDFAESLLGQQVILEALGEVLLQAVDRGLQRRGLGFRKLRRVILAQEAAHHATGERLLNDLVANDPDCMGDCTGDCTGRLARRASGYLELVDEMLAHGAPLFDAFDQDADHFRMRIYDKLPGWVTS